MPSTRPRARQVWAPGGGLDPEPATAGPCRCLWTHRLPGPQFPHVPRFSSAWVTQVTPTSESRLSSPQCRLPGRRTRSHCGDVHVTQKTAFRWHENEVLLMVADFPVAEKGMCPQSASGLPAEVPGKCLAVSPYHRRTLPTDGRENSGPFGTASSPQTTACCSCLSRTSASTEPLLLPVWEILNPRGPQATPSVQNSSLADGQGRPEAPGVSHQPLPPQQEVQYLQ